MILSLSASVRASLLETDKSCTLHFNGYSLSLLLIVYIRPIHLQQQGFLINGCMSASISLQTATSSRLRYVLSSADCVPAIMHFNRFTEENMFQTSLCMGLESCCHNDILWIFIRALKMSSKYDSLQSGVDFERFLRHFLKASGLTVFHGKKNKTKIGVLHCLKRWTGFVTNYSECGLATWSPFSDILFCIQC